MNRLVKRYQPRMPRALTGGIVVSALALASCVDQMTAPPVDRPVQVNLLPSQSIAFSLGDTITIDVSVLNQKGTAVSGAALVWTVDTTGILTMLGNGRFRATANGEVTITARVEHVIPTIQPGGYASGHEVAGQAKITVAQRAVRLEADVDSTVIWALGQTRQFTVRGYDARDNLVLAPMPLQWASTDSTVATVNATGRVTAVADGNATVRAALENVLASSIVTVSATAQFTSCLQFAGTQQCSGLPLVIKSQ